MNEQWKHSDADAHADKADALAVAIETVGGVLPMLDAIEQPTIRNAVALLERARDRHEQAAKLGRAA
jgi:hypothetical protein